MKITRLKNNRVCSECFAEDPDGAKNYKNLFTTAEYSMKLGIRKPVFVCREHLSKLCKISITVLARREK